MRFIVGIAGGTGSGKTTFAKKLAESFQEGAAQVLSVDNYYRCQSSLSLEERALLNYDHPEALELDLLGAHLKEIRQGVDANIPQYDFTTHTRRESGTSISPGKILIVEGILTFYQREVMAQLDYRIFIDAPGNLRYERRLNRDLQSRGRTEESVQQQWMQSVEPMFREFCAPTRELADLVIDGASFGKQEVYRVRDLINKQLAQ